MVAVTSFPSIRSVIEKFGLWPKKELGQNFLSDLNITDKIVRIAGSLKDVTVLEVGPGPGALTRSLLMSDAQEIVVIEKDPRCVQALQELLPAAQGRLRIIEGDALQLSMAELGSKPIKIIANLPYHISTQLLMHWLDHPQQLESLTLMFQREVAERLVAKPSSDAYGRLSLLTQFRCQASIGFELPPTVFFPAPKVWSAVAHLQFHQQPPYSCDWDALKLVTRHAFAQRRKMLRTTLKPVFESVSTILAQEGIPETARAETLTLEQFCRLTSLYEALHAHHRG